MKSIFLSKTFWVAALTAIAGYSEVITNLLPAKYAIPAMAVVFIALRWITTGPVSFLPSKV